MPACVAINEASEADEANEAQMGARFLRDAVVGSEGAWRRMRNAREAGRAVRVRAFP